MGTTDTEFGGRRTTPTCRSGRPALTWRRAGDPPARDTEDVLALASTTRDPALSSSMAAENEPQVVVHGVHELVALDKVLREAKFSEEPHDGTIAASPIVAELARRTRAALQQGFPASGAEYEVQPGRREWTISLGNARRARSPWSDWSQHEKESYVRDLLSPYDVSDANIDRFISEVEGSPK